MTSLDSLRAELRQYVTTLRAPAGEAAAALIDDDTDLLTAGVIGSLTLMSVVNHLEETYRLTVSQRDLFAGRLRSVAAIAALVDERVGRRAS